MCKKVLGEVEPLDDKSKAHGIIVMITNFSETTMSRREYIIGVAKTSKSYAEAARKVGISRERVRQVCSGLIKPPKDYVLIKEAILTIRYSKSHLGEISRKDLISSVMIGGRIYVKGTPSRGSCKICEKPIPKYKSKYCSEECSLIGDKMSHYRAGWRNLHRKFGQKITPSIGYKYKQDTKEN